MAQPSSEDTRIGLIVLAVLCGVGVFVWWMMRLGRDPVQSAAPTQLVDGQVVPFDPQRDRAEPGIEWTRASIEDCDNGAVPRVVIRVLVPSSTTAGQALEVAKAEMRAAARLRHYCALRVDVAASDQKDIAGDQWSLAVFECGPGGDWGRSGEAYPEPNYSHYAIRYKALADRGLVGGGG